MPFLLDTHQVEMMANGSSFSSGPFYKQQSCAKIGNLDCFAKSTFSTMKKFRPYCSLAKDFDKSVTRFIISRLKIMKLKIINFIDWRLTWSLRLGMHGIALMRHISCWYLVYSHLLPWSAGFRCCLLYLSRFRCHNDEFMCNINIRSNFLYGYFYSSVAWGTQFN